VPLTSDVKVLGKPGTPRNRQPAAGEKRRHDVLDQHPLPDDGAPRFVAQSTRNSCGIFNYRVAGWLTAAP